MLMELAGLAGVAESTAWSVGVALVDLSSAAARSKRPASLCTSAESTSCAQAEVLGHTVNGTTYYCGCRARTTGAPQSHWFGPAGDPRGAGIGTPEAIKLVWSCHREITKDEGEVGEGRTLPKAT